GLLLGESGTGSFTLSFAAPVSALTLSDFYVRYQSISGVPGISSASGSGTMTSTSGGSTGGSTGGTPVPEPGMLGLFGAGLIGLALARRNRAAKRQAIAV
ncbi:MAG: cistern family PEP-CTERM protein, partial [Novosphingobium sp.]